MVTWLVIFLPWQIAYPADEIRELDYIILGTFIIDLLFNMRTTYFTEDNEEVINPRMVFFNYVQSLQFYIDLFSAIPITEMYEGGNLGLMRVLNLIKMVRLLRLQRLLRMLQNEGVKLLSHLINYLFAFLILFHWITCLWLLIV